MNNLLRIDTKKLSGLFDKLVDTDEQWDIAVGMMESKELSDEGMIDMHYVQDMVDDAIEEAEQRSR